MPQDLNHVLTQVFINGEELLYTSLRLTQYMDGHHTFDILSSGKPLLQDCLWAQDRDSIINRQGVEVLIKMKEFPSGSENIFKGIITGVSMEGRFGDIGTLHYQGHSPTILLDSGKTMDSYIDKKLSEIADEVINNYGNGVKLTNNPTCKDKISYIQQHDESGYIFLRRLAYQYGEWFYYDGQQLYWGNPRKDNEEPLMYNRELSELTFRNAIAPFHFSCYDYQSSDDRHIETDSSIPVDSGNSYTQITQKNAEKLYKSETVHYNQPIVGTPLQIKDIAKVEKTRTISSLTGISGKSSTCRVRIGKVVVISLPSSMGNRPDLGHYRVIRVTHIIDGKNCYSNEFEAQPAELQHFPSEDIRLPQSGPAIATVVNNADPDNQGRVQVEFPWQQKKGKSTNWIRVQSPDAGSSEKVSANRGLVFIPEKGDQVIVSFELSNPSRPYVSGSFFHGKNAKGGEKDNHLHSIITKSGHTIEFNDDSQGEWGITIKDSSGNEIRLDTKGKNIEITAPETISLAAKNIKIAAKESLDIAAEKKATLAARSELNLTSDGKLSAQAKQDVTLSSNTKVALSSTNEVKINGTQLAISAQAQANISCVGPMKVSGAITNIQGTAFKIQII